MLDNPSKWLPQIDRNPFNTANPSVPFGGLEWIQSNLAPFTIELLLFILIVASLIFLILGGIGWITSSGNKEGLAKARNTVTYAIIGLILGLASFIILNAVLQFLGVIPPSSHYTPIPERQHGEYNPEFYP